jgi:hypothetical protein
MRFSCRSSCGTEVAVPTLRGSGETPGSRGPGTINVGSCYIRPPRACDRRIVLLATGCPRCHPPLVFRSFHQPTVVRALMLSADNRRPGRERLPSHPRANQAWISFPVSIERRNSPARSITPIIGGRHEPASGRSLAVACSSWLWHASVSSDRSRLVSGDYEFLDRRELMVRNAVAVGCDRRWPQPWVRIPGAARPRPGQTPLAVRG